MITKSWYDDACGQSNIVNVWWWICRDPLIGFQLRQNEFLLLNDDVPLYVKHSPFFPARDVLLKISENLRKMFLIQDKRSEWIAWDSVWNGRAKQISCWHLWKTQDPQKAFIQISRGIKLYETIVIYSKILSIGKLQKNNDGERLRIKIRICRIYEQSISPWRIFHSIASRKKGLLSYE